MIEAFKLISIDDVKSSEFFNQDYKDKTFNSDDKINMSIYISSNILDQVCGGRIREN
jgi:hypothetical protein